MTNEEILRVTVLNSWKLAINRLGKTLSELSDEQLQQHVAPGRNRVFYLLGHLTAMHDRMFPLLGLGDRLHPELDEPYIANPDRVVADPLSATELQRVWSEVKNRLIAAFERFTLEEWLHKHTAVSDEDFAKDPGRNRLAVVLSRTNHMSTIWGRSCWLTANTDAFWSELSSAPLPGLPSPGNVSDCRELWTEMGWYPMHAASCENLGS